MAANDIYEVIVRYGVTGRADIYINTWNQIVITDATVGTTQSDIANSIANLIIVNVLPLMSSRYYLRDVQCFRVYPEPQTFPTFATLVGVLTGGDAGDPLPPQCSMIVRKRTDFAGRHNRGRLYLCGFTEPVQSDGIWAGTIKTNIFAAYNGFLVGAQTGINGATWQCCVARRHPVPADVNVITSVDIDPLVRTQRRRVSGVGS